MPVAGELEAARRRIEAGRLQGPRRPLRRGTAEAGVAAEAARTDLGRHLPAAFLADSSPPGAGAPSVVPLVDHYLGASTRQGPRSAGGRERHRAPAGLRERGRAPPGPGARGGGRTWPFAGRSGRARPGWRFSSSSETASCSPWPGGAVGTLLATLAPSRPSWPSDRRRCPAFADVRVDGPALGLRAPVTARCGGPRGPGARRGSPRGSRSRPSLSPAAEAWGSTGAAGT